MKNNRFTTAFWVAACAMAVSCSDTWDEHFDTHDVVSSDIEIYRGDAASYLRKQPELSDMKALFENTGILSSLTADDTYTLIVCDNDHFDRSVITDDSAFVENSISDIYLSPDKLTQNFGIETRYQTLNDRKNLRVHLREDGTYIDDYKIEKKVKADNGYIYYINGTIKLRRSVYEYIQSLGDNYSLFKKLIAQYEESYFDSESSTPSGFDDMGNTVYSDSVIALRNTLMDRYTETGLPYWDMRSENYTSTAFIPSNALIEKALANAYEHIPVWLNRMPTADDSSKFEKWIVQACFVDRKLSPDEVNAGAPAFTCVGGYVRSVDPAQDVESFKPIDAANWLPSVQTVDLSATDTLSNGVAYYLTDFKIPNHVVIYRVKSRFYEIWRETTADQKAQYFRWTNWTLPAITNAQSNENLGTETLPTIVYDVLTAQPTADAIYAATVGDTLVKIANDLALAVQRQDSIAALGEPTDSIAAVITALEERKAQEEAFQKSVRPEDYLCSVEFDGLLCRNCIEYSYDGKVKNDDFKPSETLPKVAECHLPAGEYRLRMGFKHSLTYSLSIYFNDRLLIKDMAMAAQGSNFHFDRGGAATMSFFGKYANGYHEGYDPNDWIELKDKAVAYDTDGYEVAIVNIPEDGNFRIRVESSDDAYLFTNPSNRDKNNVSQLMMYHWCLRPTSNNY